MKSIIRKYGLYILIPLLICVALTGAVLFLASGPQQGAFRYQIF